jgi:ribonuclease BN (tRNA processing enzyme)
LDIAFLDGIFLPEHRQEAEVKEHMTVDEAVRVASEAGARCAVLVHISPRYKEGEEGLARAASHVSSNTEVGRDLHWITVPYRED